MKKHFYTHIIEIDSVFTELDLMDLKKGERTELILIIESSVHHMVLDTVLSALSEKDKKIFLTHLATDNHGEIWKLLQEKVRKPEEKIRKAVDKLKREFHSDIQKAKKERNNFIR